jgi:hypothetical protein
MYGHPLAAGEDGVVGIGAGVSTGCEVADAEDDAGGPDGGNVLSGVGLWAGAQATTRRPATMAVATREIEERIRCPPDRV